MPGDPRFAHQSLTLSRRERGFHTSSCQSLAGENASGEE
jgi:hypothetical protein